MLLLFKSLINLLPVVCFSQDPRFNNEIDMLTGYKTRSMLSMPIKDLNGEVIGVAQVINKIGSKDRYEAFTDSDEKVLVLL